MHDEEGTRSEEGVKGRRKPSGWEKFYWYLQGLRLVGGSKRIPREPRVGFLFFFLSILSVHCFLTTESAYNKFICWNTEREQERAALDRAWAREFRCETLSNSINRSARSATPGGTYRGKHWPWKCKHVAGSLPQVLSARQHWVHCVRPLGTGKKTGYIWAVVQDTDNQSHRLLKSLRLPWYPPLLFLFRA